MSEPSFNANLYLSPIHRHTPPNIIDLLMNREGQPEQQLGYLCVSILISYEVYVQFFLWMYNYLLCSRFLWSIRDVSSGITRVNHLAVSGLTLYTGAERVRGPPQFLHFNPYLIVLCWNRTIQLQDATATEFRVPPALKWFAYVSRACWWLAWSRNEGHRNGIIAKHQRPQPSDKKNKATIKNYYGFFLGRSRTF